MMDVNLTTNKLDEAEVEYNQVALSKNQLDSRTSEVRTMDPNRSLTKGTCKSQYIFSPWTQIIICFCCSIFGK